MPSSSKLVTPLYALEHRSIGVDEIALAFLDVGDEVRDQLFKRMCCGSNGGIALRRRVYLGTKMAIAGAAQKTSCEATMQGVGNNMLQRKLTGLKADDAGIASPRDFFDLIFSGHYLKLTWLTG